jgi:hypothetical protein
MPDTIERTTDRGVFDAMLAGASIVATSIITLSSGPDRRLQAAVDPTIPATKTNKALIKAHPEWMVNKEKIA